MTEKFNPKNKIWTEKYRPFKVSEMVGEFKGPILKYLEKKEQIPHFLLHSKCPGTGKCITKDSFILTKEEGLISFEDYIQKYGLYNYYMDEQPEEYKAVISENIYCPENKFSETSYFYKGESKTIKISSKMGYTIEGTPEHKIKIFDKEKGILWRELQHIKKSDIIPIFYNTNIFGNNNTFDYIGYNRIKDHPHDTSSFEIKKPVEINNEIAYFLGVLVANGGKNANGVSISTNKDWLQKKLINIISNNFGIKGRLHRDKRFNKNVGVDYSSVKLCRFLENVCGVNFVTARYKTIPKKIFECSKDIHMHFLNGLFEDSYICKKGHYIKYGTASEQLANEVKYMMLNLGLFAKHKKHYNEKYDWWYNEIILNCEHSKKFIECFGNYKNTQVKFNENMNTNILSYKFLIRDFIKNKRKENNITRQKVKELGYENISLITPSIERFKSVIDNFLKESYLSDLKLLKDNNVFLDGIEKIEEIDEKKEVYDFHIPNTHSFYANGMINHNTTLAKAIIAELGCDALILNSSDERKIETIREKVKEFAITKSSKQGLRRCIFLDEIDGMLKASQDALRNIMETYASNVFFIMTCNNINKVIEPIQSRCKRISFAYPPKEEVKKYLVSICEKENMDYTDEGIDKLIEMNYPSIRNCVISLQDLYTQEQQVTKENVRPVNEIFDVMWKHLKEKNWEAIKKEVLSSTLDARELNKHFWEKALEEGNLKVIQVTCRNEKDIAWGSDANVIFVTSLIEMCK